MSKTVFRNDAQLNDLQNLALFLGDSLDQTIANPTAAHRWHTLLDLYHRIDDTELRAIVQSKLLAHVPDTGIEGFFRATFLADATDDPAYIAQAGRLVQQIRPFDPDRLTAFTVYVWGEIIAKSLGRADFVAALRDARIHEVESMLGRYLVQSLDSPLRPRPISSVRKVAIVTSYIGHHVHTPTMMAFQQARLLQRQGIAVHLFSAQELRVAQMGLYLGNNINLMTAAPELAALKKLIPDGVDVTLSDERFSLVRRWRDLLASVAQFDPDMVLFVGLNSPFLAPLYAARPVLGLCVHSVPPLAPVDVWLSANRANHRQASAVWAPALPNAWGHYHPYRIELKPISAPTSRAELGLAADDLVLVSAGARLQHEINGEWAARVAQILHRHPQVVWLLPGRDGPPPAALAELPATRVRVLPYQDDLRSLYRCCDVYLNPPRIGGGFSVAEAMAEGLPTLAFNESDGGDKLGEHAVKTMDAYFERLDALITDQALRERTGSSMGALFAETLDLEQSGPSLLAACQYAVERYRERAAAVVPAA